MSIKTEEEADKYKDVIAEKYNEFDVNIDELSDRIEKKLQEYLSGDLAEIATQDIHSMLCDFNEQDIKELKDVACEQVEDAVKENENENFMHDLAADVSELVKYGTAEQCKKYIEELDDREELKDYGGESGLNLMGDKTLI